MANPLNNSFEQWIQPEPNNWLIGNDDSNTQTVISVDSKEGALAAELQLINTALPGRTYLYNEAESNTIILGTQLSFWVKKPIDSEDLIPNHAWFVVSIYRKSDEEELYSRIILDNILHAYYVKVIIDTTEWAGVEVYLYFNLYK
jgi:hypothetical protein